MLTTNFLVNRTSIRDFEEEISDEQLRKVFDLVNEKADELKDSQASLLINTNGKSVYDSLRLVGGYMGTMIYAPAYIALNVLNEDSTAYIKGAYVLEELTTKLNDLGLSSCRITVEKVADQVKKSTFNYEDGRVNFLLAIGVPTDPKVDPHRYDDRKGVDEFVYIEDFDHRADNDTLAQRGLDEVLYYARFAPSEFNIQPWAFLLKDGKIMLYIENYSGPANLVDAGIMTYYIDELTESISREEWVLDPQISGERFTYIGSKNI